MHSAFHAAVNGKQAQLIGPIESNGSPGEFPWQDLADLPITTLAEITAML